MKIKSLMNINDIKKIIITYLKNCDIKIWIFKMNCQRSNTNFFVKVSVIIKSILANAMHIKEKDIYIR